MQTATPIDLPSSLPSTHPVLWVEGIISSGKSELSSRLGEALNMRVFFEPVDSNPYLSQFYEDPKRWAWPMQIHLMSERYRLQKAAVAEALNPASEYAGAILDRGLPGDRVFAALHTRAGNIHPLEWQTYNRHFDIMSEDLRPPSLVVFLDVDPRAAYERCKGRAREAEKVGTGVTLDYLQELSRGYYDLLAEIESGRHAWSRGMSVLRWPWNVDHQPIDRLLDEIRRRI